MKCQVLICLVALLANAVIAISTQKSRRRRTLIASRTPTSPIGASVSDRSLGPTEKTKKKKKKAVTRKTANAQKDESA